MSDNVFKNLFNLNNQIHGIEYPNVIENEYINVDGDSMTGVLNMNSNKITNLSTPINGSDCVNKTYCDSNSGSGDFLANGSIAMTGNLNMNSKKILGQKLDIYKRSASLNQTLLNAVWTNINFNESVLDNTNIVTRVNDSKYTLLKTGYYHLTTHLLFSGTSHNGMRLFVIHKNNENYNYPLRWNLSDSGGTTSSIMLTGVFHVDANDFIVFKAYQNSGTSINYHDTSYKSHFTLLYLGE